MKGKEYNESTFSPTKEKLITELIRCSGNTANNNYSHS